MSWSIGAQATWQYGDTLPGRYRGATTTRGSGPECAAAAPQSGDRQRGARRVSRSRAGAGQPGEAARRARRGEEGYRVQTDLFRAGGATGTELIQSEQQLLVAKVAEVNCAST